MNLPTLNNLSLDPPSSSTQTGDSSLFFKNFKAPKLRNLEVVCLKPQDLTFLCTTSSLEELLLYDLQITDSAPDKAAASALIESIKDWSKLWTLSFYYSSSISSNFFEHLVQLLTPLSREGVRADFWESIPLLGLEIIRLERLNVFSASAVIDGQDLAALVGSRMACSKGCSSGQVTSIANGLLQASEAPASGEESAFGSPQPCSKITSLDIGIPVRADEATITWLEENVEGLEAVEWV